MNAIVSIAAFCRRRRGPLASPPLVRRRAARRRPHRGALARAADPDVRRRRHLRRLRRRASALALAAGIIEWTGELGGILAGVTIVFAAGLVDDLRHLSPVAKLARPDRRRRRRARERPERRDRRQRRPRVGDRPRSGSSASRTPSTCSTTWTVSRRRSRSSPARTSRSTRSPSTRTTPSSRSRSRSDSRAPDSSRSTSGHSAAPPCSWATRAARRSASASPRSALAASWTVAGTTVATILLPLLVLAIPILDTTLVTHRAARREAAGHAGRPRPHVAPARLLRPVRDEGGAAARDRRVGHRRHGARLQRPRQRPADGDRRARDVRAPRPVRELPERPRGAVAPRRRRAGAVALARADLRAAAARRGVRGLRHHLRLVPRRVRARRRRHGDRLRAVGLPLRASDPARRRGTSSSSRSASTAGCGASRPHATSSRSPSAASDRRSPRT